MSKETAPEKPNVLQRFKTYLRDTRGELRKVSWPTRQQLINLTAIVLAVTAAMAIFLGVVDFLAATLVQLIVG